MQIDYDFIALVGGVIIYVINEIRKWRAARKNTKRKSNVDENHELDAEIYNIITGILIRYNCYRVYITQFSNGERYFTGQSRLFMTVTHERVRDELQVKKVKRYVQLQPISKTEHDVLTQVKNVGFYKESSFDQVKDVVMQREMKVFGVRSLLYLRVTDKEGNTAAVLNLHFNFNNDMNDDDLQELLATVRLLENTFEKSTI